MKTQTETKTYKMTVICWNCGNYNFFDIPFGIDVETFLDKNLCRNCKCNCRLK